MRKPGVEYILGAIIFVLTIALLVVIYKQIVTREDVAPIVTMSPRYPMDVTVTQPEFDNGEETTIHIIEKGSEDT